ncbi:MAG: hypothetical protein ACFB2W_20285 [Leptolyngbyaceae cyanobacterium]
MLSTLLREHSNFISRELEIYLRDCCDHSIQLLDIVESYRDACATLMDIRMNMPELNWYWGYPFVWFVMAAIALGLIYFFWRRGWFKNFF